MSVNSDFVLENIVNEERFRLKQGMNSIGRINENSIRLQSPLVSRKHCTINVVKGRIFIRDEGSSNGIYINNRQITERSLIELRENDIVGIGAVIDNSNDVDLDTKMVFKLMIMPMKTDFPTRRSPSIDKTQIFEKIPSMEANISVNNLDRNQLTDDKNKEAIDDRGNFVLVKVEHNMSVDADKSISPEFDSNVASEENKNQFKQGESSMGTKATDVEINPPTMNGDAEFDPFQDEIVISDDEEFIFSQSILNKVKDDLAELDDDIVCISDDEGIVSEASSLEGKEVFDSWRQTVSIEEDPKTKDTLLNFQPSTLNWMYSQTDVLLCKKKPVDAAISKVDVVECMQPIMINSTEKTEDVTEVKNKESEKSKEKDEVRRSRRHSKKDKRSDSKDRKNRSEKESKTRSRSKDKNKETKSEESSKKSKDKPMEDKTSKSTKKADNHNRATRSSSRTKIKDTKMQSRAEEKGKPKKLQKNGEVSNGKDSTKSAVKDVETVKNSTLRRRSKSLFVAKNKAEKITLPPIKENSTNVSEKSPENQHSKISPIKRRRLSETCISSPKIEYISPLESPILSIKRKQATRTVKFDEAQPEVKFIKPSIPVPLKKPQVTSRSMKFSQYVDKGNELVKIILNWNPEWFKTMKPEINGVNPTLVPILNNFENHEDYKNVFYPLVKEEIWSCMSKNYAMNKPIKVYISNMDAYDCLYFKCNFKSDNIYVTPKDIVIIYIGNKNNSFKMFGQVIQTLQINNKERVLEVVSELNKTIFDFIRNENIKEIHVRVVFPKLDVEAGTYSAIENMKNSPLAELILNPLKLIKTCKDTKAYKYVGFTALNKEQEELVVQSYAMSLNKKVPLIKLVEGPPGTGKSRLIQNTVFQILYGNEVTVKPRILVCAQSNTAVDIIMKKLIEERKKHGTKLIRYGVDSSMHPKVLPFSVNSFVLHEWNGREKYRVIPDCRLLELRAKEIVSRLHQLKTGSNKNSVQTDEIRKLELEFKKLNHKMSITKESKYKLTKFFVANAEVVCTTLPSCVRLFNYTQSFDICIIDEATQCTEPWSLMPLQFGIRHLLLVGDTQQLPATVTSMTAQNHRFGQSLFSRIQNSLKTAGVPCDTVGKLTVQYRMHPEISSWPNEYFYGKTLQNAPETETQISIFKPFSIFNLIQNDSTSAENYVNYNEIDFIFKLVLHMKKKMSTTAYSYGVITPYAKQRNEMLKRFSKEKDKIYIDTIDSVQGVERDIVIYSNTRTNGVGFLVNPQRLNVALTRAKKCLIVIGTFKNLLTVPVWKHFISNAKNRGTYYEVDVNKTNFNENVIKMLEC